VDTAWQRQAGNSSSCPAAERLFRSPPLWGFRTRSPVLPGILCGPLKILSPVPILRTVPPKVWRPQPIQFTWMMTTRSPRTSVR